MNLFRIMGMAAVAAIAVFYGIASGQPVITYGSACPDAELALGTTYSYSCPGRGFLAGQDWNCCECGIGKKDHWPGMDNWFEQRMFYEWSLPLDSIPYGSVVKYAIIRITYEPTSPDMDVHLYKVQGRLFEDSVSYWYDTEGTPLGYGLGNSGTITATFDSTSNFVDSLQTCLSDSLNDNYFSLGVKAILDTLAFDWWTISCCQINLTIGFTPPSVDSILITNVVHGVEHYAKEQSYVRGDNNKWDQNGYVDYNQLPAFQRPPVYPSWYTRKNHLAETWFYRFDSTLDMKQEKYQAWNQEPSEHYVMKWFTDYRGDETEIRSYAADVKHTSILSNIELYIPRDSIPFDFRDPWRVVQEKDVWKQWLGHTATEHSTPYLPWDDTTTLGVFLNQSWTLEGYPFYSVLPWRYLDYKTVTDSYEKNNTSTLKEGDGIFLDEIVGGYGWSFDPQGSITSRDATEQGHPFRQNDFRFNSDSSEATALYKVHLMSDGEAQPTMRCNQRKIDIDSFGVYHMVYESAGEIWYTQSQDSGSNWSREELVSDLHTDGVRPSPGAIHPSIAVLDSSVYVTYNDEGDIYLKRRYKGEWMDFPELPANPIASTDYGAAATPVVDANHGCSIGDGLHKGDVVLIVWEDVGELHYSAYWMWYRNAIDSLSNQVLTDQVYDQPKFPSVINLQDELYFGVAWHDADSIWYKNVTLWNCNQFYATIGQRERASEPGDSCVYAPSLTRNHDELPVLAYEAMMPSSPPYTDRWVNVRTRSSLGGWQTTDYMIPALTFNSTQYGDPLNPTIGAHFTDIDCGGYTELGLRVAYHQNWGGGTRVVRVDCSSDDYQQISDASFPSMVPYAPYGKLLQAYSVPMLAPLPNAVRTTNVYLGKTASSALYTIRDVTLQRGDASATFGICSPRIEDQASSIGDLAWNVAHDTLVIGRNTTLEAKMRTDDFTVSNGDRFMFDKLLYSRYPQDFPQNLHYKLQLRRSSDGTVLMEHPMHVGSLLADSSVWSTQTVNLNALTGETVYATVGLSGNLDNTTIIVRNVLVDDDVMHKLQSRAPSRPPAPGGVTLDQNMPNPFSNVTNITFTLPEQADVLLTVTDNLGRTVETLARGYHGAGSHTYLFNGANLPNGIYYCTLTVNGSTLSRTMSLVR